MSSSKCSTLALDFDGVICNSIDECLLTSYNAYHEKNYTELNGFSQRFKEFFYRYRHLVRPAGEYFLLYKAFYEQIEPLRHETFFELKDQNQEHISEFSNRFFTERTTLKDDRANWLSLHSIYPHVSEFLTTYDHKFFVVTTKDRDSVNRLMEYFGLAGKVKEIYSKEISEKKDQLFTRLLLEYSGAIQPRDIKFVDDSEWHLADLQHMGMNLFFAEWGYAKVQGHHNFESIRNLGEIS